MFYRLQESGPKENSVKMAVASAAAVMVAGSVSQVPLASTGQRPGFNWMQRRMRIAMF